MMGPPPFETVVARHRATCDGEAYLGDVNATCLRLLLEAAA
jgi:hypothetical protein